MGARRIPDVAANEQPIIHADLVTRAGRLPDRLASDRLSTTARVSRPRWVRFMNRPRPNVAATAMATMMPWSIPTLTSPTRKLLVGKNGGTRRRSAP